MDYYSKLSSIYSRDELEDKISKKILEFHNYISREAAITLIAKENNIYKKEIKFVNIKGIEQFSKDINLKAKVASINQSITYPSGKRSRSIVIEDESGKIEFVLWEKNIELLNKIRINDELELLSCYERNGRINLGYRGKLKILKEKGFSSLDSLEEANFYNLKGIVSKVEQNTFFISDGPSERKISIISGKDRFESLKEEDEIILENVKFTNNSIEFSSKSRLFFRRPKNIISGIITDIQLDKEDLIVLINNKRFSFQKDNIYKFLNVKSNSLSLETLIKLKKEFYMDKKIFIKFKNENKEEIDVVSFL